MRRVILLALLFTVHFFAHAQVVAVRRWLHLLAKTR